MTSTDSVECTILASSNKIPPPPPTGAPTTIWLFYLSSALRIADDLNAKSCTERILQAVTSMLMKTNFESVMNTRDELYLTFGLRNCVFETNSQQLVLHRSVFYIWSFGF